MANAKCRTCDRAADAGAYCSSCAADIMVKALNPFFGERWKKSPRPRPPRSSYIHRTMHGVGYNPMNNLASTTGRASV